MEDLAVTDEQDQHPARYAAGMRETKRDRVTTPVQPACTARSDADDSGRTAVRTASCRRPAIALHRDERCRVCRGACDIVVPGIEHGCRTRDSRHCPLGSAKTRTICRAPVTRHGRSSSGRTAVGCSYVNGVAFSVATLGVVVAVRERMLAITPWVAVRVPTRTVDATGRRSNRGVYASRSGISPSPQGSCVGCPRLPRIAGATSESGAALRRVRGGRSGSVRFRHCAFEWRPPTRGRR